ncbi:hypothetical protein QYE76_021014 [Lolium multiflorum]|uniref:Uncharacterized protein n=1 Tax=Lolium multiflorum TaxID=4521 RepID=A0AAD8VPT0_LOLMU|nr:hypothetical protein QYE76_021014 [Lolium multiflorum]
MGKPRDTKVAILPSTTRKCTTLSTSAAFDSPSVISQLVSPPQASRVGISAESGNSSNNFDDASTVLDNTGSLGPFLDATIARSRKFENTETPNENTVTPVNSPETDDLDEDYVELVQCYYYYKKRTPDEAEELLAKISKNHDDWSTPEPTPTPILKKRGMIELNDEDMREAKKSLVEKGIKSEDVKNLPPIEDLCKIIPLHPQLRILFADGDEREVLLPQPDLFSVDRKPWSRSKEEVDEQLKIQGFHQQHDSEDVGPSYDYTVTYPIASSSTYPEQDPSSSYYGDTTSWGPWE